MYILPSVTKRFPRSVPRSGTRLGGGIYKWLPISLTTRLPKFEKIFRGLFVTWRVPCYPHRLQRSKALELSLQLRFRTARSQVTHVHTSHRIKQTNWQLQGRGVLRWNLYPIAIYRICERVSIIVHGALCRFYFSDQNNKFACNFEYWLAGNFLVAVQHTELILLQHSKLQSCKSHQLHLRGWKLPLFASRLS